MSQFSLVPYPSLKPLPHVSEVEARAIWLEAVKPHIRYCIKTLWFTGLRISEALHLTVKDIQREGVFFSLAVQTEKLGRKKDGQAPEIDRLPLPREFGLELWEYVVNEGLHGKDHLFPANRSTYWRQIQQCAKKAGLPNWQKIHPHSFRHGFVYAKASQGVHPYILSKLARHRDLRTTLGYYQPSQDDLRQAMEK